MSQQEFVVAERPRLSAAAILLLILIVMNAVSIFAAMSYWSRVQQLQNQLNLLRIDVKALASELEELNENMKHYRRIDELVQLYIQQLVIKTYKELFPELSIEDIEKLVSGKTVEEEEKIVKETVVTNTTASNTTVVVVED